MQLHPTTIHSSNFQFDEGTFTGHIPELDGLIDIWLAASIEESGLTIIDGDEELVFEFAMIKTTPFPNIRILSWHFACVTHDRGHLKAEIYP
jgi:hypothetical protein